MRQPRALSADLRPQARQAAVLVAADQGGCACTDSNLFSGSETRVRGICRTLCIAAAELDEQALRLLRAAA